jgi:8-oxo-dGTP diphosphatase
MDNYEIIYINNETILPEKELISAVFLIAFNGSKILAIENDRGWDIPGGHIEGEETPEQALIREVKEEAGATFSNAKLFAMLKSDNMDIYKDKVMFMYTTNEFFLDEFIPSEDAFGREVIEIEEFLKRYKGSFIKLTKLIYKAKLIFNN